jgi:hypothetical protein
VNLIKSKLAGKLGLADEPKSFVVKRNNAYSCISSSQFRFLDICNFLAPGCSYAKFIEAYECQLQKGYMCYEYLDSPEKLQETCLPPHSAFYSALKGKNISLEEYEYCQKMWEEHNMQTLGDFLCWYNLLDVIPFCEALEKMWNFYVNMKVDIFKDCISIPGVARKLVFRTSTQSAHFAIPDKSNKEIYEVLKKNLVGGPSIVFNRHQENGKTRIRGGKMCKNVTGYDAAALYLYALAQMMPCGPFTVRREETSFKK